MGIVILSTLLIGLSIVGALIGWFGKKKKKLSILGYKYSIMGVIVLNLLLVVTQLDLPMTLTIGLEKSITLLTLFIFRNISVEFYRSVNKKEKNSIKYFIVHITPIAFSFLMAVDFLRIIANSEISNHGIDVFGDVIIAVVVLYEVFVLIDLLLINITYAKASLERYRQVYLANILVGIIYVVITSSIFFVGKIEDDILVSGILYSLYVTFLTVNYIRPEWLPSAQIEKLIYKETLVATVEQTDRASDRRALDSLTGVFTREYFIRYIKTLDANDHGLTVILMNITGLKLINESFGYEVGDEILQEISVILSEVFQSATIARMSGSLFVVMLTGLSEDEITEKIRFVKSTCSDRDGFIVNLYFGQYMRKTNNLSPYDVYKRSEEELYYNKIIVNQKHQGQIAHMLYTNFAKLLPSLSGHLQRCSDMSYEFGQYLDMDQEAVSDLKNAALLHDIALTIMPTIVEYNIAFKDAFEKRVYKSHVSKGYDIAIESGINSRTAKTIMHHHENYNGSGYPHGLEKETIPNLSQIIAIVDLVDMIMFHANKTNQLEDILISKIDVVFSEELIYNMIAFLKKKNIIEETA